MSKPADFLLRWSRRKRAATDDAAQAKRAAPPANAAAEPANELRKDEARDRSAVTENSVADAAVPTFDPATLPSIDSITAETDIRGFFAPGVPPELTRAALRRLWVSDPKIRDFVGPADYAWDFNTPGSALGFGPLTTSDELGRKVAELIGRGATEAGGDDTGESEVGASTRPERDEEPASNPRDGGGCDEPTQDGGHVAPQHEAGSRDDPPPIIRRHGRALPK
jgi:uncharacterized protein DUF3306